VVRSAGSLKNFFTQVQETGLVVDQGSKVAWTTLGLSVCKFFDAGNSFAAEFRTFQRDNPDKTDQQISGFIGAAVHNLCPDDAHVLYQ